MRLRIFIYLWFILLSSSSSGAATTKTPILVTSIHSKIQPILVNKRFDKGTLLRGDWDSSGDIDTTPPYLPSYPFHYDCRIEMTDHTDERPGRLFAIADFSFTNSSSSLFRSKDLKWQWLLVEDDGTESLFDRPPRDFLSRDDLWLSLGFSPGETVDQDQIVLSGSLSIAVNPNNSDLYWISENIRKSTARSKNSFRAETTVTASSLDQRYPTLSRTVQVTCQKVQ